MGLKFDRSEPGVWVSGALHAALLAGLVLGFASQTYPEAEEGIPVEVITDSQFSEITRGETNAKQPQPDPKPRAERVAEVREERDPGEAKRDVPTPPTRPADMKVAEEAVEGSVPPPPPAPLVRPELPTPEPERVEPVKAPEPPRREPVREAEAKPEPTPAPPKREALALAEQQEAELRAKAEAQVKAEAEARARAAAEAKARAEAAANAKAVAEARTKAEAEAKAEAERQKKLAEAKAKAEAEAKAKKQAELAAKFDPNGIARMLQSREPAQSSGSTGREVQRTAALGTATGTSQRLSPSLRNQLMGLLRDQLHRCWQPPIGAQSADRPPVPSVRVSLNQDGSLAREPAVVNASGDPLFRTVADSATRATKRCSPLRIPAQFQPYYEDWKNLVVNFDPRDLT